MEMAVFAMLWTQDTDCSPLHKPCLQKDPEAACFPWVYAGRLPETLASHSGAMLPLLL